MPSALRRPRKQYSAMAVRAVFVALYQQGLIYLYSEEEKEYRVDACQSCRKYIKTVDSRVLNRCAYPALEQVASLHLDLKAAEAGYTAALSAASPT